MTTSRLILMYVAWLLAAGSVAVTIAVLTTELFAAVGLVDRSGAGYGYSLGVMTAVLFVALAVVPFAFRDRFVGAEPEAGDG